MGGVPAEAWTSGGEVQHMGLLNLEGCHLYPSCGSFGKWKWDRWAEVTKRKSIQSKDAPSNDEDLGGN